MRDGEQPSDGGYPDPEVDAPGHDAIATLLVFAEGGLAPLSLLLGWWLGHAPLAHFRWDVESVMLGALAALPPALAFVAMLQRPVGPLLGLRRCFDEEFVPLLVNSTWADLVLFAIAAGVGEEMLFRGVFQSALADSLGDAWGLVLASLLFGVLHPLSVPYAVVSFSMGLYLGVLFLMTGNLLAAMTCNGVYDFVVMAYLLRPGDPDRTLRNPIDEIDSDRSIDDPDGP